MIPITSERYLQKIEVNVRARLIYFIMMLIISSTSSFAEAQTLYVNVEELLSTISANQLLSTSNKTLTQHDLDGLRNFFSYRQLTDYDPNSAKPFRVGGIHLYCTFASGQFMVGLLGGGCIAYEVFADGKMQFRPLDLSGQMLGIGLGAGLANLYHIQLFGANSVKDIEGVYAYFSSNLSAGVGVEIKYGIRSIGNQRASYGYFETDVDAYSFSANVIRLTRFRLTPQAKEVVEIQLPLRKQ